MSTTAKTARLWLNKKRGYWYIRDAGMVMIATGCKTAEREAAEAKLGDHIARRPLDVPKGGFVPATAKFEIILAAYGRDHGPDVVGQETLATHCEHLLKFWGSKTMLDVHDATCRAYRDHRTAMQWQGRFISITTANKELGTLQAAMYFFARKHAIPNVPRVTKALGVNNRRDRVLERVECARMIRAARRLGYRHLVRFIMIGLYTGTRLDAILRTRWIKSVSSGHFDLVEGVYHRIGEGERRTKKQRPPCTIPDKLLWFLKRWKAADDKIGMSYAIHTGGQPIEDIRTNWNGDYARTPWTKVIEAAGLASWKEADDGRLIRTTDVTPHVLRHTCATWLLRAEWSVFDVAGHIGASATMVEQVYGHYTLGSKRAKAIGRKRA